MPGTFTATISDWARDVEELHLAIFREASQRVVEDMLRPRAAGGNMPVDTGYLRASLMASTSSMPTMRQGAVPVEGATYSADGAAVSLVIAGAEIGETLFFGFVAQYARVANYKTGYLFVELAAQKWQSIVSQVEAELAARAGLQ